jgi:hypothetical protein
MTNEIAGRRITITGRAGFIAHHMALTLKQRCADIELPDVASAIDGPPREKFFIEHRHVFSATSIALLAGRAGFSVLAIERLREPSGKYTLRAFLEATAMA